METQTHHHFTNTQVTTCEYQQETLLLFAVTHFLNFILH